MLKLLYLKIRSKDIDSCAARAGLFAASSVKAQYSEPERESGI